jgi:predicted PurR-regulated permease PerM
VPRIISFVVLVAIVLLVAAVSFRVMAQFIVPIFLACVLLVVFAPLHARITERLPGRPRLTALLTTTTVLLVVLLPLTWLGWKAYSDCYALFTREAPQVPPAVQTDGGETGAANAIAPDGSAAAPSTQPGFGARLSGRIRRIFDRISEELHEKWGVEITSAELEAHSLRAAAYLPAGVQAVLGFVVKLLVGLVIMMVALYYFLADGPAMIRTLMRLSPLDDRYERELLKQFADISRAVVVATLLSAIVQGTLAGVGYYFALPGEAPVFLLTAATMVLSMVPFIGAAGVWVPTCVVMLLLGHWGVALGLAIYCLLFVSLADNVIKPFILHGRANLHPLLALLSILGGVQALGPVGILVGPMLVSFLQALLEMLRKELDLLGAAGASPAAMLAASAGDATAIAKDSLVESSLPANSPAKKPSAGTKPRKG